MTLQREDQIFLTPEKPSMSSLSSMRGTIDRNKEFDKVPGKKPQLE